MLKSLVKAILHAVRASGKPYRLWAEPEKRPAAPPVATRQCKRNLLFRAGFDTFTRMYPGEPRARRRSMAREWAKNRWRQRMNGVEVGA